MFQLVWSMSGSVKNTMAANGMTTRMYSDTLRKTVNNKRSERLRSVTRKSTNWMS
jgi:hypothetical protein